MIMPKFKEQFTAFFRGKQAFQFDFKGENISGDGGVLLLEKIERKSHIIRDFEKMIPDYRDQSKIKYSYFGLIEQRVYQLALGYMDCNDAAYLHEDPVMKVVLGNDLCSQPTLSRLENTMTRNTIWELSEAWVDRYIASIKPSKNQVVIDLDATDAATYGGQQLSLFNGFKHQYQLDQLLFLDGETGQLILPVLRPGNSHSARWAFNILGRIIDKIRLKFPEIRIVIRADAGFSCPEFYELADAYNLIFAVGIPANKTLQAKVQAKQEEIKKEFVEKGLAHQHMTDSWNYQAQTWEKPQKVYAKIESTEGGKGLNTRFFVSNLEDMTGEEIYWDFYVKRGETCENRIKEFKNMCYSDRMSCHSFWANYLRVFFSGIVYEMFREIKEMIKTTDHHDAQKWQVDNIRLFLLKAGATITCRVRTVTIRFSCAFAQQELFRKLMAA